MSLLMYWLKQYCKNVLMTLNVSRIASKDRGVATSSANKDRSWSEKKESFFWWGTGSFTMQEFKELKHNRYSIRELVCKLRLFCFPRGVWNVPYVSSVYLVKASLLRSELKDYKLFNSHILDPDMAYCHNIRNKVSKGKKINQLVHVLLFCVRLSKRKICLTLHVILSIIISKVLWFFLSGNLHIYKQHAHFWTHRVNRKLPDQPSSQWFVANFWKYSGEIRILDFCTLEVHCPVVSGCFDWGFHSVPKKRKAAAYRIFSFYSVMEIYE